MTVRRLVVRSSVAAAIALGSIVVVAPQAVADNPCDDGSARVFFVGAEPKCLGPGSVSYSDLTVSKVCSVGAVDVLAVANYQDAKKRTVTSELNLSNGTCGRFEIAGQLSSTITISRN